MATQTATKRGWTPPRWLNTFMTIALQTPLLQRWLGRSVALITVTGRRTGVAYSTPVTYHRSDGSVVILTRRDRAWWRNIYDRPATRLRLSGTDFVGLATLHVDDESVLHQVEEYYHHRRFDARSVGVALGPEGQVDRESLRHALSGLVVIVVDSLSPI